eukprot:gene22464-30721_t
MIQEAVYRSYSSPMIDDDVSNSYTTPISSTSKKALNSSSQQAVPSALEPPLESTETFCSSFKNRVDNFFTSIFFADSQHPKPWFLSAFNLYAVVKSFIDRTLVKYNAYDKAINLLQLLAAYVNGKMGINISIEPDKFASKLLEYSTVADNRVSNFLMQVDDEFDFFRNVLKSSSTGIFQFIFEHVGSFFPSAWIFLLGWGSFLAGFIFAKLEQLLEITRLVMSNIQQRFPETYDRVEVFAADVISFPARFAYGVMIHLGNIRNSSTASIHSSYDSARAQIDGWIFKLVIYSLRSLKAVSLSVHHRMEPSIGVVQPHLDRILILVEPIAQKILRWFESQKEDSRYGPYLTRLGAFIQAVASSVDVLWTAIDQAAKDEDNDEDDANAE